MEVAMNCLGSISIVWQDARLGIVSSCILAGAVAAGLLAQFLVFYIWQSFARREGARFQQLLVKNTKTPARYFFPLFTLLAAVPLVPLSDHSKVVIGQVLNLCLIAATGWAFVVIVQVIAEYLYNRYPLEIEDNLSARRIRTQAQVMQRVAIVLIVAITLAAMLMTFPNARQIGTSIFASAGVAGLVVGMAARSTFASLIAGLQVALTQPIRIDDSVVVEGEWGWIEEIQSTYVVVRLWDLRRLIVPLTYFIERPFQNWTRKTSEVIGTVFIYVDYSLPVAPIREEFHRILKETKLWNSKTAALQVTDFTEKTMQIRAIMSANNASAAFDLRCFVRERLVCFLQQSYSTCLPMLREQHSIKGDEAPNTSL
jgi:small-conductance mechanosensitive channel